ncbi:hypothetical protein N9X23_02075 [Flavobacteriales bacterium]|nr:hypothetical protein [Flavobacteriales bacterium]
MNLKLLFFSVGIFTLISCSNVDDNFLTKNKWSDGMGSVFVFDTEGDNGNYNPMVIQNSSVLTRLGSFKIDGDKVIIDWTNGNPDWKLKKSGSNLKLIISSGNGVKLKPI